jgi:hypothetical protein
VKPRRLLALLCLSLVGVLAAVGLVVHAVAGPAGAVGYAVVAVVLVACGAVRGRRVLAPPPLPPGRTCTCCTTTHYDPVEVVP